MSTFISRRYRMLSNFIAMFTLGLLVAGCGGGGGGTPAPAPAPGIQPVVLSNFQPASTVIGQPDFNSNAPNNGGLGANTLNSPVGAPAEGSLYLADQANSRVLGFNTIPTSNNASADFVLGQPDFISNAPNNGGRGANTLGFPFATVTANGKLFVVDFSNRRVLIWNTLPTSTNVAADVVLGAPDFATAGSGLPTQTSMTPTGIAVAGGRLFVVDEANNRLLIWNTIPTLNNTPADVVLGQSNFTSNGAATTASRMNFPFGVWSDGVRVVVADRLNHRVLIWSTVPASNGAPADLVIGQPNFNTAIPANGPLRLNQPRDVYSNGLQLFVADFGNNRILVYNTLPTTSQPSPDVVLGQSSFTNVTRNDDDQDGSPDATPSARTLSGPTGVITIGNRLFVTDNGSARVLIYQGQ